MKKSIIALSLFVALTLTLTNCKKGDDGPIGPAGPVGAAGPTGEIGTANVIYSTWANVTFAGSGTSWSAAITAPAVTQDIMDKGVVKTYFKFGSSVYEGNYANIPTGAAIYFYLTLGSINLRSTFAANYPWRYVVIPGGIAGRSTNSNSFMLSNGNVITRAALDKMSYQEICKEFNIQE